MIALLAAVAEETRLLRQACPGLEQTDLHGLDIWRGTWGETSICLAHGGVGKAAAAAAATTLLVALKPSALWLFGCGGACPGSDLAIGDLALADLEVFADEGVETVDGFRSLAEMHLPMRIAGGEARFNRWPTDNRLTTWAEAQLSGAAIRPAGQRIARGPFLTVSTCTGSLAKARHQATQTGAICENMEGAAVALACLQTGIPLLELRGISNHVEDRDEARWDLQAGMTSAQKAVTTLLDVWRGPGR